MDFLTVTSPPIPIHIDGKEYRIPRFLMPDQKAWAIGERQAVEDNAVKVFKDKNDQARFKTFYQAPRIDIFLVDEYAKSVEGAAVIIARQWKKAGVPDADIAAVIANSSTSELRAHAVELCSASQAAADAKQMSEASADPLALPPVATGGSPGTGLTSSEPSTPTTESIQIP